MVGVILEETLEHAMFLTRYFRKCDLQYATIAVLMELDIPTNCIGYDYLKNAIILFCSDPFQAYSQGIYQLLGERYGYRIDTDRIETAIRDVIDKAWRSRDEEVWDIYFGFSRKGRIKKPSNTEFITRIGCFMGLWQGCCREVGDEK